MAPGANFTPAKLTNHRGHKLKQMNVYIDGGLPESEDTLSLYRPTWKLHIPVLTIKCHPWHHVHDGMILNPVGDKK